MEREGEEEKKEKDKSYSKAWIREGNERGGGGEKKIRKRGKR